MMEDRFAPMNPSTTQLARKPLSRSAQIAVVAGCTIFNALAQMLFKFGTQKMDHLSLSWVLLNWNLMGGLALYGAFTVLMVLALRDGELSTLFPVISLSYVWVTLLSIWVFNESMNLLKGLGVATIVLGVGMLGRGGKK